MNVDDYVTKVTRLAKRLPDLEESVVRHAIIRGLKPHIRSHVLQADVKTMAELLHAARVAEMASSAADTEVSGALEELRESNRQQLTAFQQLSDRINKLSMTPLDNSTTQNEYNQPHNRSHFANLSCFTERRQRPSPKMGLTPLTILVYDQTQSRQTVNTCRWLITQRIPQTTRYSRRLTGLQCIFISDRQ